MRRIFLSFAVILTACSRVFALELPENVGQWHALSTNITPLITGYNSEQHGRITYRTYKRESPSGFLEVILTEGTGPGKLYIPEKVNASQGMMPCDSGFETAEICGYKSVIEKHDYIPLALSVSLSSDATLTVETCALDEAGIIEFSENMIRSVKIP